MSNNGAITKNSVQKEIDQKIQEKKEELDGLRKEKFSSDLDFIHDKSKMEAYIEEMEDMKLRLNKSKTPDEFALLVIKYADKAINDLTEKRRSVPSRSRDTDLSMSEVKEKRGLINGRISSINDVVVMVYEINNKLAKGLAEKLDLLKK